MGKRSFEHYADLARSDATPTEKAGRYRVQEAASRNIVADVMEKLRPTAENSLLEIGCGQGGLLVPLSFQVQRAVGIDHPDVVGSFRADPNALGIELNPGGFLETDVEGPFDRILAYSVLHLVGSEDDLKHFVEKALGLLAPDGRLLLGDLPNADRKRRFLATESGRVFQRAWDERRAEDLARHGADAMDEAIDDQFISWDDARLLGLVAHVRSQGYEAYLLRQPSDLPFGRTREDVLVLGPEA